MPKRRTLAAAVALVLASVSGSNAAASAEPSPATDITLTRYQATLEALPPIGNVVFRYSETRSGPTRALAEEHRVYRRDDGEERNETVAVNGTQVVPAIVRFSSKPVWPYDVREFVVDSPTYNVLPLGTTVVGGKRAFGFSTVRATPGDFAITGLYLDTVRYLPLRETFEVSGGGCAGNGSIAFGPVGEHWLPTSASVSCAVAPDQAAFKESITFTEYVFPETLPPDVFGGKP
jgi:hypothetical protein